MDELKAKELLKQWYKFAIENGIEHLSVVIMPIGDNIKGYVTDYTQGANYKTILLSKEEVNND